MTRARYVQWMAVWKWFLDQKRSPELEKLQDMLNEMWNEDRKTSTSDELSLYAGMEDDDAVIQKYLDDLDLKKPSN